MHVIDIMTKTVITVSSRAPLSEAIALLIDHKLSGLPVVDEAHKLCGVLSEGDLLRRLELDTVGKPKGWRALLSSSPGSAKAYRLTHGRHVGDVMTTSPVSVEESASLAEAVDLMERFRIKRLPVLRDGALVGMVSRSDFVKALRTYLTKADGTAVVSDAEIRELILAALNQERWANDYGLTIHVENGRVELTGCVTNDDQRRAARVAVENVSGVTSLDERLTVFEPSMAVGL